MKTILFINSCLSVYFHLILGHNDFCFNIFASVSFSVELCVVNEKGYPQSAHHIKNTVRKSCNK